MRGTQSGRPLPRDRWASIRVPSLVLDGGKSPTWMRNGCRALASLLPGSTYRTLPGQTHMVKLAVLAPALIEFLAATAPVAATSAGRENRVVRTTMRYMLIHKTNSNNEAGIRPSPELIAASAR